MIDAKLGLKSLFGFALRACHDSCSMDIISVPFSQLKDNSNIDELPLTQHVKTPNTHQPLRKWSMPCLIL